ncbi:LysM peptidoglycan-binding domain-containing protein [Rothia sp. LK2588]|uniref:LysM peptidoglycan-binding domain-containing protein n=1 Tax=Rothia sp. LK2588 TaxID=3114369 RepID=UPI0034CE377B
MFSMKLTRRGRFVFRGLPVLTLAALLVLGALMVINPPTAKAGNDGSSAAATQIVKVRAGQSLWDIASEHRSGEDVRNVVNEIMVLNDLDSVAIHSGQELQVPVYAQH